MHQRVPVLLVLLALFAISPALSAVLAGTVVDADGAPVEGATVWCYRTIYSEVTDPVEIGRRVTGHDGRFSFEDPEYDTLRNSGEWSVCAHKQGLTVDGIERNGTSDRLRLRLVEPSTISGAVTDEHDEPIEGAQVYLVRCKPSSMAFLLPTYFDPPAPLQDALGVRTDTDGSYSLSITPVSYTHLTLPTN